MTALSRILRSGLLFHVLIVALFLACSLAVLGQTETATLTGTITDPSGANVAGASVHVTNVETGAVIQTSSNGSGLYVVPNLRPGHYRVIVEKAGFKQMALTDLTLNVQDIASRNFQLQVGTVSESVTVNGEGMNINTSDASVSTVVDQSYVQNMPLNGRSFQDLILLTPGTVTLSPQANGQFFAEGKGLSGEFSINGQRTESNYYTVDGVSANVGANGFAMMSGSGPSGSVPASTALGTTQALVSVDSLQEFRVQSSSYSAEYGRNPGGQIAFETKSGNNQFHGTAFDYLRNDYFDANNWFNDYFGFKQAPLRQNDFGGTLGGPVRLPHIYNGKDRTFFFVSYEGLRLTLPQAASINYVPDLCMRGDASCVSGRAPAPGVLQPVLHAFPIPNGSEDVVACDPLSDPTCPSNGHKQDGLAQFISSWSNPSSIDSTSVRFDQMVSDKLRLFFRFSDTQSSTASRGIQGTSPSVITSQTTLVRTYTAGANSLLTASLSNDFRFNYSSNYATGNDAISAFGDNTPINFAKIIGLSDKAAPAFLFLPSANATYLFQDPNSAAQRQWNLVDTLNLAVGRHQLKFGTDYRRLAPFAAPTNPTVEYFYFDEPSVESNFAFTLASTSAPAYPLFQNFSAFVDDQWKALPKLNISMGLRWEVNPAPGVTHGLKPYTALGSDPSTWSLAPQGTPLWKTTWFNFAPRLGAAYIVRDNTEWQTVVRGGGGLFFDTGQQLGALGFNGPGFAAFSDFLPGTFPVIPAIPDIVNPPIPPYPTGPDIFPQHLQLPYTLQWNASVEQGLGHSQALTISYVGSHASRLLSYQRVSTPTNTNSTEWAVIGTGMTSGYDALETQFRRQLSRGLTALASYTWSHCIDYGSYNFNYAEQRGSCDSDVRHNFSGAFSFDIPNLGHNSFLNALVHHWGLDNRFTARTAFPVNLLGQNVIDPSTGKHLADGLNVVSGKPTYIYGAQCAAIYATDFGATLPCPGGRAINPDAFVSVSSGLGNVPRNFARGFGAWQMDMAVRREFPIFENLKLQFRAEAFNVFNHPNFGTISVGCGPVQAGVNHCTASNFGQVQNMLAGSLDTLSSLYQMGGPRSMQLALKLIF
jgi:Carboxypeptidase regulatory-like domain